MLKSLYQTQDAELPPCVLKSEIFNVLGGNSRSPCTLLPWASAEGLWGKTGNCPCLEIGTRNGNFLENLANSLIPLLDLILAITAYLPVWHTLHKSQVHSSGVMQWWAFNSLVCSAFLAELRNLRADSTVCLHCVTVTRQQIFNGLLQVAVVAILPHATAERKHLGL